jgi:ATP-dependent DNA helicase RecQ
VGGRKLGQFGPGFLKIILAYAEERGLAERPLPEAAVRRARPSVRALAGTVQETVQLFEKKLSLERIALMRRLSVGTVLQHLEKALDQGKRLEVSHVTSPSPERLARIGAAFQKTGSDMLTPVRILLGEEFSYDEIRVARLLLKAGSRRLG